jgi:hypothetical protein
VFLGSAKKSAPLCPCLLAHRFTFSGHTLHRADFYYFVSQRQQINRLYRYAILGTVAVVLSLLMIVFTTLLVVFSTRDMEDVLLVMKRVSSGTLALLFVFW